ncbi:MAG TPA: hypothetical protein PLQ41_01385 [bacterium]|nr:hypothetical protein [bacterium]HPP30274.1 hypothetical protein [bacterium]
MLDSVTLYSIITIGLAFILITLSAMMLKINRKKFVYGVVLSVIYTCLAVYYLCLVLLYPRSVLQKEVATQIPSSNTAEYQEENREEAVDFTVIITTEDNTFSLAPDGELEIKKETKFKIEKVVYPTSNQDEIKADIRGFAGNAMRNDLQDMGYWATYKDMKPRYAITGEKDKFEVQIKDGDKLLGSVYIKFVD